MESAMWSRLSSGIFFAFGPWGLLTFLDRPSSGSSLLKGSFGSACTSTSGRPFLYATHWCWYCYSKSFAFRISCFSASVVSSSSQLQKSTGESWWCHPASLFCQGRRTSPRGGAWCAGRSKGLLWSRCRRFCFLINRSYCSHIFYVYADLVAVYSSSRDSGSGTSRRPSNHDTACLWHCWTYRWAHSFKKPLRSCSVRSHYSFEEYECPQVQLRSSSVSLMIALTGLQRAYLLNPLLNLWSARFCLRWIRYTAPL